MKNGRTATTTLQDGKAHSPVACREFDTQRRRRRLMAGGKRPKCYRLARAFFGGKLQTPAGLVIEYFRRSGCFAELGTESIRGYPRPDNDPYADRMAQSDPVYAVWGHRTSHSDRP